MANFVQQVVAGLGTGAIYGALALALVLIHRATGVINFAQGEMAMFTTFICWSLITNHDWSYWPAFFATLVFAFALGLGIQRVVIQPVANASLLTIVIMTIGLVLVFNGLAALIWGAAPLLVDSPTQATNRPRATPTQIPMSFQLRIRRRRRWPGTVVRC